MNSINSIILIDDNNDFIRDFTNEAYAKGITVAAKNSLAGLKLLLPAYGHKYAAVVLDIKCLLQDDQAKEDSTFIGSALTYLNSTVPLFPRFILTGDESEFDSLKKYHADEKMFIKKPDDQNKLLDELLYCVQNAEPLRIKRENVEIFDAFEQGLISAGKEITVINIFKRYNEKVPANFRGIIGDVREVHEEIYKSLNNRNKNVVPDTYMNANGTPSFTGDFYKYLLGNPNHRNNFIPTTTVYQDTTISSHTKFIHNACSEYLHGSSRTNYHISTYTIKSLINSLMEIIIWSKLY
ncbi:hypothetical protein [Flavobacterium sp. M31R6]|uniref:hypothetical protein n=1 Tax=Flavobacterium sp. M31R6 TaxID=2739062 RepID=UPI001569AB0F|nr:hypothetical protein [Flavobacterium sp. M31R6]QKJ62841.1 hypothetical protein HQN62_06740 [Flavobacterium sp. M31R6]